jgi:small-conductance mechanosensitive channel
MLEFFNLKENLYNLVMAILTTIYDVWNYTVYTTTDKQPITLANIVIGLILMVFGLRYAKKLSSLTRSKILNAIDIENNVREVLENIIHYALIVLTTLLVLDISHVPLTVFGFVGGTLAISLGFGSRNILENFISGLIIMVEQPIRIGDYIEIDKNAGRVVKVGARCINIRTSKNIDILIPNSAILQNKVTNWTLNDDSVKLVIEVPIDKNVPTRLAEELILKTLEQNIEILKNPMPHVYFDSYSEDFLNFEVCFWVKINNVDLKKVISDINHAVKTSLNDLNITPPPS